MTAPIKTCDFCNATGVMPTFMDGTTACYDCLPKLPKTMREAWREIVSLRAKIERMERQEPVGKFIQHPSHGMWEQDGYGDNPDARPLYAFPGAQAQPAQNVPDDVVEQAVNRFLSWKLPKDFHPDGGMVFIPTKGRGYDSPHWPVGTNLLNAQQAREMLRYVLASAPEAKP